MPRKTTKALVRPKLPDRKYNSENGPEAHQPSYA